ncbi:MAG TPA: DUF5678 domain-containing protein [Pyrinomonadaceae bacterium]|nr:DUF5678 domain-containing protein [Pyrinomonadaceae bacterium]
MATLEQILEEAKQLPVEEQRRLRVALEALDSNGDTQPAYRTNEQERAWINAHRDEYLGQWVALDGGRLIAHGADARTVYLAARAQGVEIPYVDRIEPLVEAFMGGWQ